MVHSQNKKWLLRASAALHALVGFLHSEAKVAGKGQRWSVLGVSVVLGLLVGACGAVEMLGPSTTEGQAPTAMPTNVPTPTSTPKPEPVWEMTVVRPPDAWDIGSMTVGLDGAIWTAGRDGVAQWNV
ncbi:MAG: hypothetical protein PVI78_09770, partial [Anaerolineales bacterium]